MISCYVYIRRYCDAGYPNPKHFQTSDILRFLETVCIEIIITFRNNYLSEKWVEKNERGWADEPPPEKKKTETGIAASSVTITLGAILARIITNHWKHHISAI